MDPKHLGWCGGISSIVGGPTPCAGQANGRNKGMETTALTDAAKRRATVRIRIKFRNLRGERGREAWIYADWGIGPKRFDWVKRVYEKPNSSRIETSEHQMSHRQVDPALARLLRPLVILAQSAVAAQPGERPLDDPTPLQDLELLLPLGADDQLEDPAAELLGPLRNPSVVDPVGQDLLQPGESPNQLLQDRLGPVPILDARRVDDRRHHHPQGVHHQMPLPAVDLLVRILAVWPSSLGRLDALTIDDAQARTLRAPVPVTDLGSQDVGDLRPSAVVAPLGEVIVAGAPGGQVLGHHPPGAATAGDVEDAVADLAEDDGSGSAAGLGLGQQPLEPLPLGSSQVGGVSLRFHLGSLGFHAEL